MGRAVVAAGILCAVLAAAGCGDDGDDQGDSKSTSKQRESFLFVQEARSATLDTVKATLTLRGASPSVQYFSDRPARVAGVTSVDSFRKSWTKLFGADPPNAAIQHLGGPAGARAQVAELLGPPRYRGGRTLTYPVKLVDPPKNAPKRVALAGVSLFIDPCLGCVGSLQPKQVSHCSPIDPRCATADAKVGAPCPSVVNPGPCDGEAAKTASVGGCTITNPHCTTGAVESGCTPIDPRCKTAAASNAGCTITDPRCPTAVKAGCSPWDPRCKIGDASERCRNPYDCQLRRRARCVYSPTTPDCPSLEDRPGCNWGDTHDCPGRAAPKKEQ